MTTTLSNGTKKEVRLTPDDVPSSAGMESHYQDDTQSTRPSERICLRITLVRGAPRVIVQTTLFRVHGRVRDIDPDHMSHPQLMQVA